MLALSYSYFYCKYESISLLLEVNVKYSAGSVKVRDIEEFPWILVPLLS